MNEVIIFIELMLWIIIAFMGIYFVGKVFKITMFIIYKVKKGKLSYSKWNKKKFVPFAKNILD